VPAATHPISPKMIEISGGPSQRSMPPKSVPPTMFVLKNGERLESHHYTLTMSSLRITASGNQRTIPLAEVDLSATLAANHERGINLKIPTKQSEIYFGM